MVILYNMTVKLEHIIVWTAVFQVANIWVDLCISRKRFLTRFFHLAGIRLSSVCQFLLFNAGLKAAGTIEPSPVPISPVL
ncbi:hypothetical protein [Pantoea ananatis]|jgi:hypothetical protein|uniref:hypothetical protein n=1 Tax=Pantoea ananas TaxID=553 RepID=UPI0005B2B940|nr:hypothetical protein [Pantoea ananatis]MDJ0033297.1 hypothetical protein [Pantoea ananatis]MDJ0046108.1 hypothetical protein [Pantoea ananatis]